MQTNGSVDHVTRSSQCLNLGPLGEAEAEVPFVIRDRLSLGAPEPKDSG